MEQEISQKLKNLEEKLDAIYMSTEKTRKMFFWTLVITVVAIVLPLFALIWVLPAAMEGLTGSGAGF